MEEKTFRFEFYILGSGLMQNSTFLIFTEFLVNLKIGFDLMPKADGNPSVRIREFEDFNLRKMGRKAKEMSVRGEDTSPETEEHKDDEKEDKDSDAVAVESSDSEEKALRSTKGIHPDEFEPERHPELHNRGKEFDTETEER